MERIAGTIRARLLNPGERLPSERDLALSLGVSRSTIRAALQHLVDAGWLEIRRGRNGGSFVARWPATPEQARLAEIIAQYRHSLPDLLDYRRAVESGSAALAAERATADEIDELHRLNDTLGQHEHNIELYRALDARLHIGIARAAHSTRLMESVTSVEAAMTDLLDAIIPHSRHALGRATAHHQQVLSAIAAHQPQQAAAAMTGHLAATEHVIYELMPELEPSGLRVRRDDHKTPVFAYAPIASEHPACYNSGSD